MPLTAQQAVTRVNVLYDRLTGRRREVEQLERYFRGEQPLAYASAEWRHIHQDRYKNFADNWCGVVGSAPGERTEVHGIRLAAGDDDRDSGLSDVERRLWEAWELNEGPAQSSQGFLTSTIAKRSSVLVWGDDDGEPVMTWEHPSQMVVDYDANLTRRRRTALKAWVDGDRELATLYTADQVWKFQRPRVAGNVVEGRTQSGLYVVGSPFTPGDGARGWEPRQDDDDTWPIENPMGVVPVVEYPNRPMLGGEPLSDIAGTMAMQDAVNMLWAYLFVAADFASMPARVVMGQEPPKVPILDENGQKIGEKPVDSGELKKGRLLWLTGQSTTIGQWDPAKLDVFTDTINVAVKHVAAQTRTPIYLIHGELGNVNGETLTGLDAPLNSKVRESHKFYTSPVRETFALFALVWDQPELARACRRAAVKWKNPEVRSDAQVSDAALKDRQIGWSFEGVLEKRYGLSQPEIEREMDRRRAEAMDPLAARVFGDVTGQGDDAQVG